MSTEIHMPSYILPELLLFLLLLMIGSSAIMPWIDRRNRRFFIAFFSVLALGVAVFTIDMATYMDSDLIEVTKWLPLIEYMLFPLPVLIFAFNLLHYFEDKRKKRIFMGTLVSLWIFYCLLHVIAHFTSLFYYTSPDGRFFLKPLHPLLFIPVIAINLTVLAALIRMRGQLSRKHLYASVIFLATSIIAMTIHAFIFAVVLLNLSLCASSIAMYIIMITDQIEQYMRQQAAIASRNASIMVLKMRPHFIYNTMTSIYYLCEQDPKKAQQVILDLTSYLRKNFNAMVSDDTIPFSKELEHIRAYLAVELAQYEDRLIVEYDTPHTRFRLPPLTLQPLVENAVRHGMDPDSGPLHILIRTSETSAGNVILVQDNGSGFDPDGIFDSDNALSNIRQRLEIMCHGSISITSRKGGGTAVKVVIP